MEDSKEKLENPTDELENNSEFLENNSGDQGSPVVKVGATNAKKSEDMVETFKKKASQPSETKRAKRISPLSIRTDQSTKDLFQDLSHTYGGTHEEFIQKLLHDHQNPPEAPEPSIVEKTVEVIKEVEKGLPENSVLVLLSEKESKLLDFIANFRFKKGLGTRSPGEGIVRESKGDIVRKSFFNKHRLRDIDGEFYTGLTSEHFKS